VPSGVLQLERRGHAALLATLVMTCVLGWIAGAAPSAGAAPQKTTAPKDYALIYGTVWNPDDTPAVGVPITIHPTDGKKPKWELVSDRRGEFAQRVPPGKQDYLVQADIKVPKGQPKPEIIVHIQDNERQDISVHLTSTGQATK